MTGIDPKSLCPWTYRGMLCGYTGDLPTCDKTLADCRRHYGPGEGLPFGGLPTRITPVTDMNPTIQVPLFSGGPLEDEPIYYMKPAAVLDKGIVGVVQVMGSDLSVVNSARVSMGKFTMGPLTEADRKLIQYLAKHEHTSPFRHAYITFHIKAPIFVFRQWMKHVVGCAWNEMSMRYVEAQEDEFYLPSTYRSQPTNVKQGSGEALIGTEAGVAAQVYLEGCRHAVSSYKALLRHGVAREQARCVLPVAMYSEAYWTASLQALGHFLHLRQDGHAQSEIRDYADAVRGMVQELFPVSTAALLSGGAE